MAPPAAVHCWAGPPCRGPCFNSILLPARQETLRVWRKGMQALAGAGAHVYLKVGHRRGQQPWGILLPSPPSPRA